MKTDIKMTNMKKVSKNSGLSHVYKKILIEMNYYFLILLLTTAIGCKKFVEVPAPTSSISSASVFTNNLSAIAAVTNIYTGLVSNGPLSNNLPGVSGIAGLSADELDLYSGNTNTTLGFYYTNNLSVTNGVGGDFWSTTYAMIYQSNSIIEGLNNSSTLTPAVKQQLLGEAKFSRALGYFYLINLYGDVPLALTTDYTVNSNLSRTSAAQVYIQIISDLNEAKGALSANFLDATLSTITDERVRPTKWAASALLARVYLYTKNWNEANNEATNIINNTGSFGLVDLDNVFLKNSQEAIWQMQPINQGLNTLDGFTFVIPNTGPNGNQCITVSNTLLNSFEVNDQRKNHWIGTVNVGLTTYSFPYKYKVMTNQNVATAGDMTEYEMVLRLGEQYLIRSEAEANGAGGGLAAAIADLNAIRKRAGLANYSGAQDQASVLSAIYKERRVELFSEWGHRWLDLKRTGKVDAVMGIGGASAAKGGTWSTNQQLYPIPLSEIKADPKLVQNPGY